MSRRHAALRRLAVSLLGVLPLVAASACAVPASVDGTVLDNEFTIRDESPQVRPQNDGSQLIVLADDAGGVLRLVKLRVARLDELVLDQPVAITRDGAVSLEVALGTMDSFVRKDGAIVVTSTDATFVAAVSGTLTLASVEPVAGDFEVELEDGGRLLGSFVIDGAR